MSAMTVVGSLTTVQTAYDRLAYWPLRDELYFDAVADVKPTKQDKPGNPVSFTTYVDLAAATSALNESVDVDAVAMDDGQTTVTLVEYGNAVITSAKVRGTSFLSVDSDAANAVGYNAGMSQDLLARAPLAAGSNVLYGGTAAGRTTIIPTSTLSADNVRKVGARFAGTNVRRRGGYYTCFIHPDVAYDLRRETGAAAWRDPHTYSQPAEIWNGEMGVFEGFRFIDTPRAPIVADAGSSTTLTDVYQTIFCGAQALAKTYSMLEYGPNPSVVQGPVVDKLMRFHPIGWKWLGGYGRFREAALYRYETSSSIGANAT